MGHEVHCSKVNTDKPLMRFLVIRFLGIGIFLAVIFFNYQNCSAKKAGQAVLGSSLPASICDHDMFNSEEWTVRWGNTVHSPYIPPVVVCPGTKTSALLQNPQPEVLGSNVVWSLGLMSQTRPGFARRNADVSFAISKASEKAFDHVSAFAAYYDPYVARIGASVDRTHLYVEVSDAPCFGNLTRFKEVLIPGGLKFEHWYRIHTQVRDLGKAGIEIKAFLSDGHERKVIAETDIVLACVPSWYRTENNRWLVGASAENDGQSKPALAVMFADFDGRSQE